MANNDQKRRAHFTYIWKIESAYFDITFESPMFTIQSMEMTKWFLQMRIYRRGEVYISLHRGRKDGGPESIEVEFELSFLATNGTLLVKRSGTEHIRNEEYSESFESLDVDGILDKIGDEFLPKDTLTLQCCIWRKEIEIPKSELCFATTHFDIYQLSCVLHVKGFSFLQLRENRIHVLNSTIKGCPKLILTLSLLTRFREEFLCISVEAPILKYHFWINAETALLDAEGSVFHFKTTFTILREREKINLRMFRKRELIPDEAVLFSDDVLILRCEFKLLPFEPAWSRIEDYKIMDCSDSKMGQTEKDYTHSVELSETAVCPFKDILNSFRGDGTLSDISLRAGTKSFPVHKLILSSRSSVFKAMFTNDMKEKASKCIDIPDLDADTLNGLLSYIYENKVQELTWETAANLFEAADKYELLDLKEKCSDFLKSNFSNFNVCEILILSDAHNDEGLLNSAQNFIQNNSEIIYSDSWKVFRENNSKLAWETAEKIIRNTTQRRRGRGRWPIRRYVSRTRYRTGEDSA